MWLMLSSSVLLLLFGSKFLNIGLQLVLFAIHKLGLLSRIRVDEHTTIQLTVRALRICLWRNVWKCVWSPSQVPLVTIEVSSVHLLVSVANTSEPSKTAAGINSYSASDRSERGKDLDSRMSFKRLDHPLWTPVRTWMHRLPFICFLLPLVGVSVSEIAVDVVQENRTGQPSVVRVQKGSLALHCQYHRLTEELELLFQICQDEIATIAVPTIATEIELHGLQLKASCPISRAETDTRAPLPSSISVSCGKIGGSIDLAALLDEVARIQHESAEKTTSLADAQHSSTKEMVTAHKVLPMRLMEILPEMHVKLSDVSVSVVHAPSSNFDITLKGLECHLQTPPQIRAGAGGKDREEERKLTVEIIELSAASGSESANRSSSVRMDTVNVDVDTRLSMCVAAPSTDCDDPEDKRGQLLWSTRVGGEVRGLSVCLADDLAPLVDTVHSSTTPVVVSVAPVDGDGGDQAHQDGSDWGDALAIEVQVQFKFFRSEILCAAPDKQCAVLPHGVPDIGLSVDEIVLFANPFVNDETMGIRAKLDLQALRLKLFYVQRDRLLRTSFLSIDFVRVFVEPVNLLGSDVVAPAEVEMEAEWLEIRWTPEAMHSIGGMLDLGIVVLAPLLCETYDWTDDDHWRPHAARDIPTMKTMVQVADDHVAESEAVKFRCKVKRGIVTFSHTHGGAAHVDFVTVDTLSMSVEETTGRFRLSLTEINASHTGGAAESHTASAQPLFQRRYQAMRRRTTASPTPIAASTGTTAKTTTRRGQTTKGDDGGRPFFFVKVFALEETKLRSCPWTVLDLFVDGVACKWSMETQERIVELIRRITFATWEMLYRMRSAFGTHCTSPTSRYNRVGGLNPALNDPSECEHAEQLFQKLISAGGDALNRIHATNIDLQAEFPEDNRRVFGVKLHVGLFASDDLPELWLFEDIRLVLDDSLELLGVDRVVVRHTVDRRRDYVFGFFEEALRLRKMGCGKLPSDSPRTDGMLIDVDGLRVGLSLQLDLMELASAIQSQVVPHAAAHMRSFAAPWRPQDDLFYLTFLRIPKTPGQPLIWLQLSKVQIDCVDRPMEAWLEHVYPLWMEELAEQELRSQLLEEQVTSLKLTNADMLVSDSAANEMKQLLHEKSSKIYMHKVKRLQANAINSGATTTTSGNPLHDGSLMTVCIGFVSVDVSFEASESVVTRRLRQLDEATAAVDRILHATGLDSYQPKYSLLVHQHLAVSVRDISVRMRKFLTPVAIIEAVKIGGDVIVAANESPSDAIGAFAFSGAVRCFLDLDVAIERPVAFFGPAYLYTMHELASIVERMAPALVLDIDTRHQTAPWDVARRLLHGKLRLRVDDLALRLLAASHSFEGGDYLEVAAQRVDVTCQRTDGIATEVNIERLTVKIEPDALVNIAEISSLALQVKIDWAANRDAAMHYLYPVEFTSSTATAASKPSAVVDFATSSLWRRGPTTVDVAARLDGYAATDLSVSLSGKIAPPRMLSETMSRREIASRSAIVLYTKHVEWLIRFGRIYQTLPAHAYPSRRHCRDRSGRALGKRGSPAAPSPVLSTVEKLLRVFKSAVVEEFSVAGLDVALYHSEKSPVGIRACINDKVAVSGSVAAADLLSALSPSKSKPSRSLPVEVAGFAFVVDNVSVAVHDIQVRICTPKTGSRGESLVAVREICLYVGGDSKAAPPTDSMPLDFAAIHSEFNFASHASSSSSDSSGSRHSSIGRTSTSSFTFAPAGGQASDTSRTKSKKTILEHFDIQHHNPYCFRDDDADETRSTKESTTRNNQATGHVDGSSSGQASQSQLAFVEEFRQQRYVLGLVASEIRVLVTLDTVETLVDIVENWIRVVRGSLPELHCIPDELLRQQTASDQAATQTLNLDSPKKVTSLADDPKFGAIFHASNPLPTNRTHTFHMDRATESDSAQASAASPSTTPNASVVEPFLTVRFMDCQINLQDHQNKGSVLLALSCGSLRHSRSLDISHELIDLKVDGVQLFTAPLDIDVRSRIIWLITLRDGVTYCPSSYGLLRQVVAPIPTHVMIWIDRDISVLNRVDLRIPAVEIGVSVDSKNILQNMALAVMAVVTAKLAEYTAPDYSKMLQGFRGAASTTSVQSSLQQLVLAKRQLQWKIAELHWHHTCRWNYQVTERASMAMHALEGVRAHGLVDAEATHSPFLHARRMSSASFLPSTGTSLSLTGSAATHVEAASDELQQLQLQCASITEVIRSIVAAELLKRQPNPNVQLAFTLQRASLTLSAANSDIVSATMASLKVKFKMYEDQASTFALTIQDVSCMNLCPNTPYPELLQIQNSKSWSGDDMFLRVDADVAAPVGGIQVVRHFEVNVHPMQVCLSYDLILQLVSFFGAEAGPTQRQEEKKAEMRSQFLAAPQQSSSCSSDGLLKKAVKVAGKAAHPLTHGLGRSRVDTENDRVTDPKAKALQSLQEEASQWISRIAHVAIDKTGVVVDEESSSPAGTAGDKDVNEMRDRAKNNIMFKRVRLGTVEVMVSFKNKKHSAMASTPTQLPLEDMRGFEVKIHSLVYCDKTCSLLDLLLRIRRDIILDVLSQVGRNFTNVANFLRDQFDITRWAAFDALAPLKSLSTAITGAAGHTAVVPAIAMPTNPPSPAGRLSVDLLQRSPRVSRDGASPVTPTTPVDASKVFQLELPENHPSRKKKHASRARPSEPAAKLAVVADAPMVEHVDDVESPSSASSSASRKPKSMLSSFFGGKSKKTLQSPTPLASTTTAPHATIPSAASHTNETAR